MSSVARPTHVVARGAWGTVEFAILESGKSPAKSFFENDCERIREKGGEDPQSTARARFAFLFQQMANYGPYGLSPKRFKKEMGSLWAFRHEVANVQIRFPCFRDGNAWIVTHGFEKPGAQKGLGDWPESHIYRAQAIETEYRKRVHPAENKHQRKKR